MVRDSNRRPGAPALWIGAALAAVVGALLVEAGIRAIAPTPEEPRVRRFVLPAPPSAINADVAPALAPDGRRILYSSGADDLWIHELDAFQPRLVEGTRGARGPFWSHHGRTFGFSRAGSLWVHELGSDGVSALCPIPGDGGRAEGSWGADGTVILAANRALYTLRPGHGPARVLLDPAPDESELRSPACLPDGRHLVAVARRREGPHALILVSYPEGTRRELGVFENLASVCVALPEHLVLGFEGGAVGLGAAPISLKRLDLTGEATLVAAGGTRPSASDDGTLAYLADAPGSAGTRTKAIHLVLNWREDLRNGGTTRERRVLSSAR
jgi:hypothetical protein